MKNLNWILTIILVILILTMFRRRTAVQSNNQAPGSAQPKASLWNRLFWAPVDQPAQPIAVTDPNTGQTIMVDPQVHTFFTEEEKKETDQPGGSIVPPSGGGGDTSKDSAGPILGTASGASGGGSSTSKAKFTGKSDFWKSRQ